MILAGGAVQLVDAADRLVVDAVVRLDVFFADPPDGVVGHVAVAADLLVAVAADPLGGAVPLADVADQLAGVAAVQLDAVADRLVAVVGRVADVAGQPAVAADPLGGVVAQLDGVAAHLVADRIAVVADPPAVVAPRSDVFVDLPAVDVVDRIADAVDLNHAVVAD